jgi:hypothetical protein
MNILTIVSFFSGLFSIGGAVADWFREILFKMLLFFDGIAYTLLAYAYKLFQLMCTLNFNSLYGMISGILTRIEALIMVFVVYKLGISLINFMLNPEEAAKKGKEILINIFITAALLLSYNTIFTLFNELSMLIIGTPENYNFVVLGQIADITGGKDSGLINRLVFGTDEEMPDIGEFISFSICSTFITDSRNPQNTAPLQSDLNDNGHLNFNFLPDIASQIGKKYDYFYLVGFVAACYMIYSFVKTTIQIGVRAFKLLILQVLAPVAIITVIGEGVKGKTFKNFISKYIAVYIEVFIRMFSMLLICNFVVKFIRNIGDYFPAIDTDEWYTYGLMIVLIIVAAFKFAGDIPKFIDGIIGTHLADNKDGSFGKFVGGLLGGVAGGVTGFFGGLAGGGFGGAVAGLGSGIFGGAKSGAKGKNVADFFKGQGQIAKDTKLKGQGIAARGGLINTMRGGIESGLGIGDRQDRQVAKVDRRSAALDLYDKESALELKQSGLTADKVTAADFASAADYSTYSTAASQFSSEGLSGVKFSSKDEYKEKMRDYNDAFRKAQAKLSAAENASVSTYDSDGNLVTKGDYASASNKRRAIAQAQLDLANAAKASDDAAGDMYEAARQSLARKEGTHTHSLAEDYRELTPKDHTIVRDKFGGIDVKKEQADISSRRYKITDRPSYSRTHGQNPNKK